MKIMNRRKFALVFLGVLLMLAGCSSNTSSASATQGASDYNENYEATAAETVAYTEAAAPGEGGQNRDLSSSAPLPDASSSRKLIRTVDMNVETTDFDTLVSGITSTVSSLNGYIEESNIDGNSIQKDIPGQKTATIRARIPGDKLDQLVKQVEGQGNVIHKSERTSDVTLQYADTESRKRALTVEQERVFALLEKADTLEVILSLESHLSDLRYQLESLESQLRLLDNQTSYSTVILYIEEVATYTDVPVTVVKPSVATRIQTGLSNNLKSVGTALTNIFVTLIVSLPYLVLLAVIVTTGIFIYKKTAFLREQKKDTTPETPDNNEEK